jgi:hypothetical protein
VDAGVVGALGLTRYLEGMLYGITALDATTYVASPRRLQPLRCSRRTFRRGVRRASTRLPRFGTTSLRA